MVPAMGASAIAVTPTRENRFVTLIAPAVGFTIYVGQTESVGVNNGLVLPPGQPYEISLPGKQALFLSSNAPVSLRVSVQIAAALAGDLERKLG